MLKLSRTLRGILTYCLIISCCISIPSSCLANDKAESEAYFRNLIVQINQTLHLKQRDFSEFPQQLVEYVDATLLPNWSSDKTLRGLLGSQNWKSLDLEQQRELSRGFNNTLQRYVQEGFKHYDGQSVEFVNLKLHESRPYGLLTVKVIPNLLPSFNLDLKVAKVNAHWQIYDLLLEGVSYISLKQDEYKNLFSKQGVNGITSVLAEKNQGFLPSKLP